MKLRRILTVIPARSGSKGVKDKNIRKLNGKPLIGHAIEKALSINRLSKVIISTDSLEYAEIAESYGAEVPFIRPAELADSSTRLHHVMKHALDFFDRIGEKFDAVLSLQPTVPLITTNTLEELIRKFDSQDCKAVGTASEIRQGHPYLAKLLSGPAEDTAEDFIRLEKGIVRYPRQKRPFLVFFNGAAFLRDRCLLEEMNEDENCMGDGPKVLMMSDLESLNIDEEFDFDLIKAVEQIRTNAMETEV